MAPKRSLSIDGHRSDTTEGSEDGTNVDGGATALSGAQPSALRIDSANASTSASRVSHAHIQRTSPVASFQT